MKITRVPFSQFPMLAKTDTAYAEADPSLRKFYTYSVDIQSFAQVIADKKRDNTDRKLLVSTLKKQYAALKNPQNTEGVISQIEKLENAHTFTVTTAHQPSLLLGPLYFVYKIFSTINLAEKLRSAYPEQDFVPVFVIGGEDHDFEEVNSISIFNKKITWESGEKGAVGMMKTASLDTVLAELKPILGENDNAKAIFELIEQAYTAHDIYHDATQALLHALFGQYDLVVLNMNDADLKRAFIPIMQREIVEQPSKKMVESAQAELSALGFKSQAFPREINLFYLRENLRERIVEENGVFRALNTDYQWLTREDLLKEVADTPQYFSPNVVLRPLFQELILPNLAYIGGGGELAYWLERKEQFAYFGVNFPMLIRRNSAVWLDKGSLDRLSKLEISLIDLAGDTEIFIKNFLSSRASDPLSMTAEKEAISAIFDKIVAKAIAFDATLEKSVAAEKAKQIQSIEQIEAKIMKAEKQKNETTLNQIRALAQKFFPNGGLQERSDNFLPFYLKHGSTFFDVLHQNLNPLERGFVIISEE